MSSCGISVWGGLLPLGHRCLKLQRNRHHLTVHWGDKSSRPTEVVISGDPVPSLRLALFFDCFMSQFQPTSVAENHSFCQEIYKKMMQRRQEWENRWNQRSEAPISSSLVGTKYITSWWKTNWGFSVPSQTSTAHHTSQGRAGLCSQDGHSSQHHAHFFRSLIWDICSWLGPHALWS